MRSSSDGVTDLRGKKILKMLELGRMHFISSSSVA